LIFFSLKLKIYSVFDVYGNYYEFLKFKIFIILLTKYIVLDDRHENHKVYIPKIYAYDTMISRIVPLAILVLAAFMSLCAQTGLPVNDVPGEDIVPRYNESVRVQYQASENQKLVGYIVKGNKLNEIMQFYQNYFEQQGYEMLSAGGGMTMNIQIPFIGEAGVEDQVIIHFSKKGGGEKYTLAIFVVNIGKPMTYYTITKTT